MTFEESVIRIVVVDDHEMVREGLKAILERQPDFLVVGESNRADDLEDLVDRTKPHIVLLDARLPGMSGAEACRQLGKGHPDVRVIIVSTYSDDDLVDACLDAGAKGYVIKDIERFALAQSIRAVHRGEAIIAPAITGRLLELMRTRRDSPETSRPALNTSQVEILRLLTEGFSNPEIAQRVHLSENTVKSHVQEIFRKLDVHNRVEAAIRATREGWV
jgi:DNA-binding NarL/FixJ family response regulator